MCERARCWLVCGTAVLTLSCAGPSRAADSDLQLSGYYKNLFVGSQTWTGESFTLDTNRIRLAVKGNIAPPVSVDLQYDNELLLGSYLRTAQFRQQKDILPSQYWRLDANYRDTPGLYGRHRLYRAAVNVSVGDVDLRIGRQRIAWGTGRFWSPLDVLNPLNPAALEREERMGVDAVLLERKFGPLSRIDFVHAPSHLAGRTATALHWHDNAKGLDYSLIGGKVPGARLIGVDLAGQVGQAGVRAELGRFRPDDDGPYMRWLIGVDYAFANSLTLTGEFYFNGAGTHDSSGYDFPGLMSGEKQALARRYLGVHASYEITPLLKWDYDVVVNVSDRSRYLFTGLTYSLQSNLELRAGMQRFSGAPGTEYQRVPNSYYVQLQRFF